MRILSLALWTAATAFAQCQSLESLEGAVGAAFSVGASEQRLEVGGSLCFGGIHWISEHFGIHSELGIHRFGLSDRLRKDIGPATDGMATILDVPVNAFLRLHDPDHSGLYILGGLGIYNRHLDLTIPSTLPVERGDAWAGVRPGDAPSTTLATTRGGVDFGLGWETPRGGGHFFVEVRYHRIFTRGRVTEFIPVLLGTRF